MAGIGCEAGQSTGTEATAPSSLAWRVSFDRDDAFRAFLENFSDYLLWDAHYTVLRGEDFAGIEIHSMDPEGVVLVQGRFAAVVEGDVNKANASFCLRTTNVRMCLRNARALRCLDLSRRQGYMEVLLRAYDPGVTAYTPTYALKTLARKADFTHFRLSGYPMLVEMDLRVFRNAIRAANDRKVASVELRVLQSRKIQRGYRPNIFFVMALDKCSSVFLHQNVAEGEAEPTGASGDEIARHRLPSEEELVELYSAKFAVDYLFRVVQGVHSGLLRTQEARRRLLLLCGLREPMRALPWPALQRVLDFAQGPTVKLYMKWGSPLLLEFTSDSPATDYLRYFLCPISAG